MEIRYLIRILVRRWWLVVPTFLLTVAAAAAFTLSQTPVYSSSSTYVLKATSTIGSDVLDAIAILSRQTEIAETYVQAGASRNVQRQASDALSLSPEQADDVQLQSRLVPGTNLLMLTVRSSDPELARDYNTAVGDALVDYAADLYPSYKLEELDGASRPNQPDSPSLPVNLAVGLAVGLALAAGVGVLAEMLTPSPRPAARFEVLDRESSAYSGAFYLMRLRQEMSRARRTGSVLTIALVNVNHAGILDNVDARSRSDAIRRLAGLLDQHLRTEDVSARLEADTFSLLLPDTTELEAIGMVEALRGRIAAPAIGANPGGDPIRVRPAAGVVEFHGQALSAEDLLERARSALRDAEAVPSGTTQPFSAMAAQPGT